MLLIFISLIIIIFLLAKNLGFIYHKPKIPTGNVDIFDIIFEQNCFNCNCNNCNNNCNCGNCTNYNKCNHNNCNSSNNKNSNNSNNISNDSNENNSNNSNNNNNDSNNSDDNTPEETPPEKKTGVEVYDKETEYSTETQLNIFTNTTYYVVDDKIAPSTENAYQFVIRNHNDFNIKYTLELIEENKYNINMKYRLKLNGEYVSGDADKWVTYDELNQYDIGLSSNTYDVYTLEWKWFESENDTEVGTNINSNYKLELKITASEY